jgi:hypothetical protein
MVRKQIYLRRDQDRFVKKIAKNEGRTEAEVIREAIQELARAKERESAWETQKKLLERWGQEAPSAARTGRTWKREDAYDRKVFSRH